MSRTDIRKRCEYCKEVFEAKTDRTRFCSEAHRVAAWRKGSQGPVAAGLIWHCQAPKCGEPFAPRSAHQHYCSDTCRNRARYWRNKGQALFPRRDRDAAGAS